MTSTITLSLLALILSGTAVVAQNTAQDYLAAHNAARSAVYVGPAVWDSTVAAYAQKYANIRAGDCALQHSDSQYGENIAVGYGTFSGTNAVSLWVAEKKYYNHTTNTCMSGAECGHYTQVVWSDSLRIGCAKASCKNGGTFVTCNYDYPGNWVGEMPY